MKLAPIFFGNHSTNVKSAGRAQVRARSNVSNLLNRLALNPRLLAEIQTRRDFQSGLQSFSGRQPQKSSEAPKMKNIGANRHHAALMASHPDLYQRDPDGSIQVKPGKWEEVKSLISQRIGNEFQQQIASTGSIKWSPNSDRPPFRADAFVGMNTSSEVHFRLGKTVYAIRPESYLPTVISGPGRPEDALLTASA